MTIATFIAPIAEGEELVKQLLISEFNINEIESSSLARNEVKPHLDKLKETCFLLAETNYVDKVYRDSYYHYYSSKLSKYKRDCIRISIFEGTIDAKDFRCSDKINDLKSIYRGFIILRPTAPFIIGRSLISPRALRFNNFLCCSTKIQSTVNAIKFEVDGFPHSSQDTETITCAETTLWAIMEYFGTKYPEYKPTLPAKIIQTLNRVSTERQIPSKGLNIQQMSFALKEFGFGTRIYSRAEYGYDFDRLISCYIESGIPLILGIDNRSSGGNIGHAMLCIGHQAISDTLIDAIPSNNGLSSSLSKFLSSKSIEIHDWDDIAKDFIFVDDNYPVYQQASLTSPTKHYKDTNWHTCTIKHFIVPLYPKIYLDAYEAKNYILRFLIKGPRPLLQNNSEVWIRTYLASSRSFKHSLALNSSVQEDIREMILETPMPKFIWIAEIGDRSLQKSAVANGMVILDATEANISHKPLIFAGYGGRVINYDLITGKLEDKTLPLPPFSIFQQNLKNL